jgi:hypothetical protein
MPTNSSSARDRDGPTIVSETDQLQHIWQQHQLTTLKAIVSAFCQFCDQWLLQSLAECGYTGLTVGRVILPRLCPFCYHDESLSTCQRITTSAREGHPKHIFNQHIKSLGTPTTCPCYPSMCTKSTTMNNFGMTKHLEVVYEATARIVLEKIGEVRRTRTFTTSTKPTTPWRPRRTFETPRSRRRLRKV